MLKARHSLFRPRLARRLGFGLVRLALTQLVGRRQRVLQRGDGPGQLAHFVLALTSGNGDTALSLGQRPQLALHRQKRRPDGAADHTGQDKKSDRSKADRGNTDPETESGNAIQLFPGRIEVSPRTIAHPLDRRVHGIVQNGNIIGKFDHIRIHGLGGILRIAPDQRVDRTEMAVGRDQRIDIFRLGHRRLCVAQGNLVIHHAADGIINP